MRAMKDSGVEWLGDIPEGWQVKPHWAFTREKKVPVGNLHSELTLLSLTKQGVIVRDLEAGGKFPSNFEGYQQVAPNDLVLCLFDIEETPRTVGLAPTEGMITSAYTLMRVTGINPYFLEWYLIGMDNEKRFKPFYSGLRNTLQKPIFGSIRFAVPPPGEQAQIVDYLDQETSQIDALIAKKEQLIEKLLERRQALITQVVTKGLDPHVPMKDSGVEWLGEVPEAWMVKKLGRVAKFHHGRELERSDSGHYPVYGSGGIFSWSDEAQNSSEMPSVLFGRKGTVDKPILAVGPFSCVDTMYWTSFTPGVDARFVYYLATAFPYKEVSTATALPSMTSSALKSVPICLPDHQEQLKIANHLDEETTQIDTLIEKTRKAIELLKERRQALITQVVTGKIDVRGFAGGNS